MRLHVTWPRINGKEMVHRVVTSLTDVGTSVSLHMETCMVSGSVMALMPMLSLRTPSMYMDTDMDILIAHPRFMDLIQDMFIVVTPTRPVTKLMSQKIATLVTSMVTFMATPMLLQLPMLLLVMLMLRQ